MFSRRDKVSMFSKLKGLLWPRMGWKRVMQYFKHRIMRLQGTPHSIACGFAFGAAISVTPFLGFHIILSIFFAWIFRGGAVSAALGTVVGNPWTFPFMWEGTYILGQRLLGNDNFVLKLTLLTDAPFLDVIMHNFWSIIWPMTLGSLVVMPFMWALFYFPLRRLIKEYRHKRAEYLVKKRAERREALHALAKDE